MPVVELFPSVSRWKDVGSRCRVCFRKCTYESGRAGLTYSGRTLLFFLFLTTLPTAVMVTAQLPVGGNLGH